MNGRNVLPPHPTTPAPGRPSPGRNQLEQAAITITERHARFSQTSTHTTKHPTGVLLTHEPRPRSPMPTRMVRPDSRAFGAGSAGGPGMRCRRPYEGEQGDTGGQGDHRDRDRHCQRHQPVTGESLRGSAPGRVTTRRRTMVTGNAGGNRSKRGCGISSEATESVEVPLTRGIKQSQPPGRPPSTAARATTNNRHATGGHLLHRWPSYGAGTARTISPTFSVVERRQHRLRSAATDAQAPRTTPTTPAIISATPSHAGPLVGTGPPPAGNP